MLTFIAEKDGYLEVVCSGTWELSELKALVRQIKIVCTDAELGACLVDMLGVEPPQSSFERFQAGTFVADTLGSSVRLAVCFPPEHITKFAENAAVNRGAVMGVFGEKEEALAWLSALDETLSRS